MMQKLWLPALAASGFVALAVAGWWWKQPAPTSVTVECAAPEKGCTFIHNGRPVEVQFSELPVPFEPFHMTLVAPGVSRASVEFQMHGMDMGFNRHDLKSEGRARFAGDVALPACVSGSHAWEAKLALDDSRYIFTFYNRE